MMAAELGLDVNFAKRAGLLHDIGKAVDHEQEGTHIQIGADLAKKYKENATSSTPSWRTTATWNPRRWRPSSCRRRTPFPAHVPARRRETGTNYVKRLEKLEEIAASFQGVEKSYAIQAGSEVRVIVKPEQIDDAQALFLAKDIAKKIERNWNIPARSRSTSSANSAASNTRSDRSERRGPVPVPKKAPRKADLPCGAFWLCPSLVGARLSLSGRDLLCPARAARLVLRLSRPFPRDRWGRFWRYAP